MAGGPERLALLVQDSCVRGEDEEYDQTSRVGVLLSRGLAKSRLCRPRVDGATAETHSRTESCLTGQGESLHCGDNVYSCRPIPGPFSPEPEVAGDNSIPHPSAKRIQAPGGEGWTEFPGQ